MKQYLMDQWHAISLDYFIRLLVFFYWIYIVAYMEYRKGSVKFQGGARESLRVDKPIRGQGGKLWQPNAEFVYISRRCAAKSELLNHVF